jgi:hypothetical protein
MSIDLILDHIKYNYVFFFLNFLIQKIWWNFQILAKLAKFITLGKNSIFLGFKITKLFIISVIWVLANWNWQLTIGSTLG